MMQGKHAGFARPDLSSRSCLPSKNNREREGRLCDDVKGGHDRPRVGGCKTRQRLKHTLSADLYSTAPLPSPELSSTGKL